MNVVFREQIVQPPIFCLHDSQAAAQEAWLNQKMSSAVHYIENGDLVLQFMGPGGEAVLWGGTFNSIDERFVKKDRFRIHTSLEAFALLT